MLRILPIFKLSVQMIIVVCQAQNEAELLAVNHAFLLSYFNIVIEEL